MAKRLFNVTITEVLRYDFTGIEAETQDEAEEMARNSRKFVHSDSDDMDSTARVIDVTPPPRTVKERIRDAFKQIRKQGGIARMNYTCCQSCAWAEIESDYPDANDDSTIVFYHRQDAEALTKYGNLERDWTWKGDERVYYTRKLYLAHQGNSDFIARVLRDNGLTLEWDGTSRQRIAITGIEEGTV